MGFGEQFILLFNEMGWFVSVCLALGILLIIVEMFVPGIGVCGVLGSIILITGIIYRVANSGTGNALLFFFLLLLLVVVVLGIAFLVLMHSIKKGWLSRSSIFNIGTAVPVNRTEGTLNFTDLVGKIGKTTCILRPSGTAVIDGKNYDVVSENKFVEKNKEVVVTYVEGIKIVVKDIEMEDLV